MTPFSLLMGLIIIALGIVAVYYAMRPERPLLNVTEDSAGRAELVAQGKQLTFKSIVWGVFCGMWLFSLSAGLLYLILRSLNS